MVSLIVSINKPDVYQKYLLPGINKLQEQLRNLNLPTIDVIEVSGSESIYANYNDGVRKSIYRIKVFVHQDVDLVDSTWLFKLLKTFAEYPNTGLIGFVGTTNMHRRGFWWESGEQFRRGELYSGKERADWGREAGFNPVIFPTKVECIDGFFMATNRDIRWDTDLKGFHCYDMDFSRQVRARGHDVMVIPHKAWHIGEIRSSEGVAELFEAYYRKWAL